MPTIKDVAKLAGVSVSTVSIILNGKAEERKVASKTYKKVMNAINTLDYKPSLTARKLRNAEESKPTIALFWPLDYRANLLASALNGIHNEINRLNYDCDLVVCTYENDSLCREYNLYTKNKFSAAIIGGTSIKDLEYLGTIEPSIPTVLINRYLENYSTVCIDNDVSAYKAANLFAVKGHKRVAVITAETPYVAMNIRSKSFIKACRELHLEIESDFIIESKNSYEGGAFAARKFLNLENRPQALFCDSDTLALGACYIFNKEKLTIPDNLEIIAIGMSDPKNTEFSTPPITVVLIPSEKMASDCMNIIYNILNNKKEGPIHRMIDSELLLRDSCRP